MSTPTADFRPFGKGENNKLVLLTRSSTYHGQTLEVLSNWIKSEESFNLHQRLIEDLWLQQTRDEFALTLTALLCRERLLPYAVGDTAQPIGGCYLVDFDAILNGQDTRNRRTVFEQMILSLVRVLYTLNTNEETVRLLVEVLDKEASLLGDLDGVSDQYCARKVRGHDHNRAFEEVKEELFNSVGAMLEQDRTAVADWTVIPRLPLQLADAFSMPRTFFRTSKQLSSLWDKQLFSQTAEEDFIPPKVRCQRLSIG